MDKSTAVGITRSQRKHERTRLVAAVLAASAIGMTAGCSTPDPQDYRYSETGMEQNVAYGVVESVRPVRIDEDHAPLGAIAGAALGGILGNEIGHGGGRAAATVVGAVAGGIGGNALEQRLTEGDGEEVVVRLNSGRTVAITQAGRHEFAIGERVRVLTGPDGSRIERG